MSSPQSESVAMLTRCVDSGQHPDKELRQRITSGEWPVTVNGHRAIVTGWNQPFATVRSLESGLSAEWSWAAVVRVVARGGDFQS